MRRKEKEDIPDKIATTLKVIHPDSFPNIFTILQILATIPVTPLSFERSISCLRYLQNYSRSKMGAGQLNGLALMHAHRDIHLNPNLGTQITPDLSDFLAIRGLKSRGRHISRTNLYQRLILSSFLILSKA